MGRKQTTSKRKRPVVSKEAKSGKRAVASSSSTASASVERIQPSRKAKATPLLVARVGKLSHPSTSGVARDSKAIIPLTPSDECDRTVPRKSSWSPEIVLPPLSSRRSLFVRQRNRPTETTCNERTTKRTTTRKAHDAERDENTAGRIASIFGVPRERMLFALFINNGVPAKAVTWLNNTLMGLKTGPHHTLLGDTILLHKVKPTPCETFSAAELSARKDFLKIFSRHLSRSSNAKEETTNALNKLHSLGSC